MSRNRKYRAFLSYSTRYAAWVEVLHRNLERAFGEGSVFLDKKSIGVGESWVAALQRGLEQAEHLVLVATPESFASPWVNEELEAVQSDLARRRGDRPVLPLLLVDSPCPPFLRSKERLDFREARGGAYRDLLGELIGALGGDELPSEVDDPPSLLHEELAADLRGDILALVAEPLSKKAYRRSVATAIGQSRNVLEDFVSTELAANAALVLCRGDDSPESAARRLLAVVREEYEDEIQDLSDRVSRLLGRLPRAGGSGPGDSLLSRYRDYVTRAHSELVPRFRREAPAPVLEHVYVELEMGRDPDSAYRDSRQERKADREWLEPKRIDDLLRLHEEDNAWVTGRWAVKGDPGSGKTTLLRHFAHELASEASPWVPVYASLPRLLREGTPLLEGLEDRVSAASSAKGLAAALEREGEEGRLVVLLDSLDEVPREQRAKAHDLIRELAFRWKDSVVIVASRPIGYESPGADFRELRVLPLDMDRKREFLARWFAPPDSEPDWARADETLAKLTSHASLCDLAGAPLHLTLMAILWSGRVEPSPHRTRLYDQIFELLLEGKHRESPTPLPLKETARAALRRLALGLTTDERTGCSVGELESRLYEPEMDDLREQLERHPPWRRGLRPFLDDVAEITGILGPHDGPDGDWRFWHKSFGEALCAEALEDLHRGAGIEACLERVRTLSGDEGRWAEPFALLAGRVDERDALVEALVEENRRLGLRALATAQGLQPATLRKILELADDWETRSQVIGQVAGQVGDTERAILLLEQMARATLDGSDLYFIDEALREAGQQGPEARLAADRVRRRLFDHFPRPEGPLWETVQTCEGPKGLWARIEPGSFRMGTAEGDGRAWDDEHPDHEVHVAKPFETMVVPVTNAMYAEFDPSHEFEPGLESHPVVDVTWFEAVSFCRWLGGCLPTEAQWEYACRGGKTTAYWSGDTEPDLARVGWYDENSGGRLRSVGEKPANAYGLHDMHGNVLEWCQDRWSDDYTESQSVHPAAYEGGGSPNRVSRGGGFDYGARSARSAYRFYELPSARWHILGFRAARVITE